MAFFFGEDPFYISLFHLNECQVCVRCDGIGWGLAIESQMLGQQYRLIRQQNRTLQNIAELPDIPGPRMLAQSAFGLGGQLERATPHISRQPLQQVPGQERYVFGPFSQRWYGQRDGVNPKIQVAAKPLFPYSQSEVVVSGCDKVNIDAPVVQVAHSPDALFFKALQ